MQQSAGPAMEGAQRGRLFARRPLCLAALGALLGLLLYAALEQAQALPALLVLPALTLAAAVYRRGALAALVPACLVCLSALLQCPSAPAAAEGLLTGRIAEPPAAERGRQVLLLDAAAVDGEPVRGRVELTVYGAAPLSYGQRVAVQASLRTAEPDWLFYDRYRGVACRARAEGLPGVAPGRRDAYGLLLAVRAAISERIGLLFPAGAQAEAARGILLGGGVADMDEGTEAQFRAVGIAHLLAVSGLHVGVLAGALMAPLRLVRGLWARFFTLAALLLLYAALTAFTPSVLRACVMVLCAQPAMPLRRRRDLMSALSLAFVLVLLARPFALWNAGFELSFLAVGGLALLAKPLARRFAALGSRGAAALSSGVAVVVAGLPATARFFGALPLSSLAANLLVLPLVPLFFVPALLALGLGAVWLPLGRAVAVLPQAALELILRVAEAGGALALTVPAPGTAGYLLFLLWMLLSSPLCLAQGRRKMLLSGGAALLTALLWSW